MSQCPYCRGQLSWAQQYNQWYCYTCRRYIPVTPQPYPQQPARPQQGYYQQQQYGITPQQPKSEHAVLSSGGWSQAGSDSQSQVHQGYQQGYQQAQQQTTQARQNSGPQNTCPQCNSPLTFVTQYKKWYCDRCRKYTEPKSKEEKATSQPPVSQAPPSPSPQPAPVSPPPQAAPTSPPVPASPPPQAAQAPPPAPASPPPQPQQTAQAQDINISLVIHGLVHGSTVGQRQAKTVAYLQGEAPQPLGEVKMTRDNFSTKGELFMTPYRLVFVEKARMLDPNWISFWFNPDFGGAPFQAEVGLIRKQAFECKDAYLSVEAKGKYVELYMDYIMTTGQAVDRKHLGHPWRIHRADLYNYISNARNQASPLPIPEIHKYLMWVSDNNQQFTFGPWDTHMELAMKQR